MIEQVFSIFGQAIAFGGGGIAIGFGLFKWFGQKWIDSRFNRQIKELEHEQAKVVARMRVDIESSLNAILKMQEREFSILPETWGKLNLMVIDARSYVYPISTEFDALSLNDEEIVEVLKTYGASASVTNRVLNLSGKERAEAFDSIGRESKVVNTRKLWYGYRDYIQQNSLFYTEDIRDALNKVRDLVWSSISSKYIGVKTQDFSLQSKAHDDFEGLVMPKVNAIEEMLRVRLSSIGK